MRIIISDTSCMIDLRKAELLEAVLELPYLFVMPNTLFEDEWLCLTPEEKQYLCARGLEVRDLPGASVQRAARYFNAHKRLSLSDCFALALAEDIQDSILVTSDGPLRRIAGGAGIEVRGVLWAVDELEARKIVPLRRLYDALRLFQQDNLVFLPAEELRRRIRRIARLL